MANLITADYFIREVNLPGNVLAGTLADINPYIVQYERDVLIDLLGYPLYKDLKAEIDWYLASSTHRCQRSKLPKKEATL